MDSGLFHRRSSRLPLGLIVLAVLLIVVTIGSGFYQREPYSQQFSDLKIVPDFSLGKNEHYLPKLHEGQENVLIFWGSWCPHCESLLEDMQELDGYEALSKNLFTVAEDTSLVDIEPHRGQFPIYLDQDGSVYDACELEHVPSVFIVDGFGRVLGSSEGGQDSLSLLKDYVARNK